MSVMDAHSDLDLVELCNHGNSREATRAFGTLYERHKDYVLRVALRFVPDHDSALDVLQETFSYLLRKFPPTGDGLELTAELTTYLYPIAKNKAIDLMRKARRFPASHTVAPDDLAAAQQAAGAEISGLLRSLPSEQREVLLLRFVDDLKLQEIADLLAIPLGTVKSRLHFGIRQLRDCPATRVLLDQ